VSPRRRLVTGLVPLALVAALAALAATSWALMIRMPGRSHTGALPPLVPAEEESRARLSAHVAELAGRIGERNFRRPEALAAAAAYVEAELAALGYQVVSQPFTVDGQPFRNVEATLAGHERADEVVVVGGHYDSVVGTPGADDNATGTAAVIELARLLRDVPLERTVRFVAFVNEEPPFFLTAHMGSRVYARAAARRGDRIVAMLSLETIGYYTTRRAASTTRHRSAPSTRAGATSSASWGTWRRARWCAAASRPSAATRRSPPRASPRRRGCPACSGRTTTPSGARGTPR
jgi:hypothetical protein